MSIQKSKDGICKDLNVLGDNVYYAVNGDQGCSTIWYSSFAAARAINKHLSRIPTGKDAGVCNCCSCHYSIKSKEHKIYPEFACSTYKKMISTLSKYILSKNPSSGKIKLS